MKVLGISGSPRKGRTTDHLVQKILHAIPCETDFISLAGKHICPCVACLGCIRDNTCVLKDDMAPLREKLVEADAYVIGAPNYYSMLNSLTHAFLERWYQFRHQEGKGLAGKLGIAVGVSGSGSPEPANNIQTFFEYNRIDCIGTLTAQGPASCFECGFGEECDVGAVRMFFGKDVKITEDIIPSLDKQPQVLEEAEKLAAKLWNRLDRLTHAT